MKAVKWLDKNFEKCILVFLLVVMVCVMTYQVIMRYVFSATPSWADKLTQYCFVVSTFFSISYCIRRGSSLRIDMLVANIPPKATKVFSIITKILLLIFYAYFTYAAYLVIGGFIKAGTKDIALGIPMYVFYTLTFIGFCMATIRCVQTLYFEFVPEKEAVRSASELDDIPDISQQVDSGESSDQQ